MAQNDTREKERERERAHQTFTHSFCESRRRKKKKKRKKENSENLERKIEPSSSRYSVQFLLPDSIHTVFFGGFCLWFYFWWWKEQRNFILNEEEAVGSTLIDCFQPSLTITVVQNL